jgi:LPXTG-motif cell wall-anchored protein
MKRVVRVSLIATVIVLVGAGAALAQTMTHEVLRGTVLHAYGDNLVVKMDDGTVREFDVQPGFMFDIDGTATPTSELKPGTVLTADIKTTEEPHVVQTEEVRSGKVLNRVGQTLIVRLDDGTIRKFEGVPSDMYFTIDGEKKSIYDLRAGMNLNAHIVSERVETVTERQIQAAGYAPASPAAPAPRPAAKPAAPAVPAVQTLPHTGSQLPLVGLAGLALLALAAGIGILRRF